MERLFIVHGWAGSPAEGWFPWLKAGMEARAWKVEILTMPHPEYPRIDEWVAAITQAVGPVDGETYFVGHSLGCQAILRYLATLPEKTKIGGAVLVAGFTTLSAKINENPKDAEMMAPWLAPLDWNKIKGRGKLVNVLSDNDPWVPLKENEKAFKQQGFRVVVQKDGKHFSGADGLTSFPLLIRELMVKNV